MNREFTFIFVCQAGELELKACLLAASLRHFLGSSVSLLAAIPAPPETWGEIAEGTHKLLAELGVTIRPITNPISTDYPIGNKLAALDLPVDTPYKVFLDSDILCLRAFDPSAWFSHPLSAKPADVNSFTDDTEAWRKAYSACGADYEPGRLVVASHSKQAIPLYYNAGVIGCDSRHPFPATWIDCCQRIEADEAVTNKRPWLDQIGLPVAATRTATAIHALPDELNYPAHLSPLKPGSSLPILCRYHWPSIVAREPDLLSLVGELIEKYPLLNDLIEEHPNWNNVPALTKKMPRIRTTQHAQSVNDFIISGIPRSGTSLICRALDLQGSCVVVNEPKEIFKPLLHDPYLDSLLAYYKDLRCDVLSGRPITNKIMDGELTTDTSLADERGKYVPTIDTKDFSLGTKNTLSYLLRTNQIRKRLPHLKWIFCIRHPYGTISSWKSTFPHLEGATVETFPVGFPTDPNCDAAIQTRLKQIASQHDQRIKRALLWRLLAELIYEERGSSLIIKYEDFLDNPAEEMKTMLHYLNVKEENKTKPALPTLCLTGKPVLLDADEKLIIDDICGPIADLIGHQIR